MLINTFGEDAVRISALGFGCGRIGSFNNAMSSAEASRMLEQALDVGVTLFDTADIYGQGDSERILGSVLKKRRDAAFVVTKVGQTFSMKMRLLRPFKPLLKSLIARSPAGRATITARRAGSMGSDFSVAYIAPAIDRSLRRLRFERVDAVLLHSPLASEIDARPLAETLLAARKAGKIRHFGVACDDLACLRQALLMPGLSVLEVPPSVIHSLEQADREAIRARRIGVLVREVIRERGELSARAAVRRMVCQKEVACVVASASTKDHLAELVRAVDEAVAGPTSRTDVTQRAGTA